VAVEQLQPAIWKLTADGCGAEADFLQRATKGLDLRLWMSSPVLRMRHKLVGWNATKLFNTISNDVFCRISH
jgi:hypothetical protein